jgi:hypothetical protein
VDGSVRAGAAGGLVGGRSAAHRSFRGVPCLLDNQVALHVSSMLHLPHHLTYIPQRSKKVAGFACVAAPQAWPQTPRSPAL